MKPTLKTLAFGTALCLGACSAPRSQMNEVSVGMTKSEVVSLLGTPDSSAGSAGKDCLYYSMWRDFWNRRPGDYSDRYYVCFEQGRVSLYGRVGDPIPR